MFAIEHLHKFDLRFEIGMTQSQIANPLPSASTHRATWPDICFQHLFAVHSTIDPALDADCAVGGERRGEAVVHVGLESGQRDAADHGLFGAGDFSSAEAA